MTPRNRNWMALCTVIAVYLGVAAGAQAAAKRVALVIGNSAYQAAAPLPQPRKDADAVGAVLKSAGYDVDIAPDLTGDTLRAALRKFAMAARGADVALVYFAGYGVAVDRQNYLAPVDAKLELAADVALEAVRLDDVRSAAGAAARLSIVILDANRSAPFPLARKDGRKTAFTGLAGIEPGDNELISFAAREGTVAEDRSQDHSPFTAALLATWAKPGVEVRTLFRTIRDSVIAATDHRQEPAIYQGLGSEDLFLVPVSSATPAAAPPSAAPPALPKVAIELHPASSPTKTETTTEAASVQPMTVTAKAETTTAPVAPQPAAGTAKTAAPNAASIASPDPLETEWVVAKASGSKAVLEFFRDVHKDNPKYKALAEEQLAVLAAKAQGDVAKTAASAPPPNAPVVAPPSREDDLTTCFNPGADDDIVAACARRIDSNEFAGADLSGLQSRLAAALRRKGDTAKAITVLDQVIARGINIHAALIDRALARKATGDAAGAEADLTRVTSDLASATSGEDHHRLCLARIELQGLHNLRFSRVPVPKNADAAYDARTCQALSSMPVDEVISACQRQIESGQDKGNDLLMFQELEAFGWLRRGETEKALGMIEKFRVENPKSPIAASFASFGSMAVCDTEGGQKLLDEALANIGENILLFTARGRIRDTAGDQQGAEADYRKALTLPANSRDEKSARDDAQAYIAKLETEAGKGAAAPLAGGLDAEWAAAKASGSKKVLEAFRDAHKDNATYSALAQEQLALLATQAPSLGSEAAPLGACDKLAGAPSDPRIAPFSGVNFDAVQTDAIPICEAAVREHPQDSRLMYTLGRVYDATRNYGLAKQWYEKAVATGDSLAMNNLAALYEDGTGVARDYERARDLYEQAAAAGYLDSYRSLGRFYADGLGLRQNYRKARDFFEKAAAAGNDGAMNDLGNLYLNGNGVAADPAKAVEWYTKAADAGNGESMFSLALQYEKANGVRQDYAVARHWYQKAISAGYKDAYSNLGLLYLHGQGGPADAAKAKDTYEQGVEAGDSASMHNLAGMLGAGNDWTHDYPRAAKLLLQAAKSGLDFTLLQLKGDLSDWDRETRRDLQRALAKLSYYDGDLDGVWGQGSRDALEAYLKAP